MKGELEIKIGFYVNSVEEAREIVKQIKDDAEQFVYAQFDSEFIRDGAKRHIKGVDYYK